MLCKCSSKLFRLHFLDREKFCYLIESMFFFCCPEPIKYHGFETVGDMTSLFLPLGTEKRGLTRIYWPFDTTPVHIYIWRWKRQQKFKISTLTCTDKKSVFDPSLIFPNTTRLWTSSRSRYYFCIHTCIFFKKQLPRLLRNVKKW